MKQKIASISLAVAISLSSLVGITAADLPSVGAATNPNCTSNGPDPSLGTDFVTYTVPTAGTYTVWSRVMVNATANNSYYLQIDCGTPITVIANGAAANAWVWTASQVGSTANISKTLTAASHTFNLTGKSPNLIIDRVVFATNAACVPTGTGDNCAIATTPTPSVSPSVTPTSTPTGVMGDANADNKVNVTDLSILLSHWATNYAAADFNHDGTVNVTDLSILLSHWTG